MGTISDKPGCCGSLGQRTGGNCWLIGKAQDSPKLKKIGTVPNELFPISISENAGAVIFDNFCAII
jgi:hypothetical protein